jgi:hypothetical protein
MTLNRESAIAVPAPFRVSLDSEHRATANLRYCQST